MTTLFIISALVLGAWFFGLRGLWQEPIPVAAQDPPKPIETLVQQKLSEVTGQQTVTEAMPNRDSSFRTGSHAGAASSMR